MNAIDAKFFTRLLCFLIAFGSYGTIKAQTHQDAIIGVWETENQDGKMEIFKNGDEYQAKLLWGKDIVHPDGSFKKDVHNPDTKLQQRNLVGITYLKGLQFKNNQWEKGSVYNSTNGKWYKCYVWLEDGQLHLRGYLGLKVLGQTTKWNNIK